MRRNQRIISSLEDFVQQIPILDTHEHLIEESRRLAEPHIDDVFYPCNDWSYLYHHYSSQDLCSVGFTQDQARQFFDPQIDPKDKWRIFEPYYQRTRNTAYFQAVEHTLRLLFQEEGIHEDNVERISEKMRTQTRKGFYATILRDVANIESCQVNSLEYNLCETEYPDLLLQDMSINWLSTGLARQSIIKARTSTLKDWYRLIDWNFEHYGPRAIAVKTQAAYWRDLSFARVATSEVEPLFARFAQDQNSLTDAEQKALQDHLFHYCVQKAINYNLPIKLHCGYLADNNIMPLGRLKRIASDLCPLLQDYPQARFILMHIGYPYQDEFIALAKHYSNVYLDMCWAWLVNPQASIRFLKEALMAVPSAKLLGFGGDYYPVEPIVGHAYIARQGISQALSELILEDWLSEESALVVARQMLRENALRVFDYARVQKEWKQKV
ncbi:MAG TPA: amidohydrolase family protein [Ktedonobacteraceae bacterium]|nr:amidohydrolase family protein [Ktedonobacteraceae bacterium]